MQTGTLNIGGRPLLNHRDSGWLPLLTQQISAHGFAVLADVLSLEFLDRTRKAMYQVQDAIEKDVGKDKLQQAGEIGILRLMMKYHDHFYAFLEIPEMLAVLDATVSPTSILHVQNGFILPSLADKTPSVFQNNFHMDFRRVLNGYLASINVMFSIDDFQADNGATLVVLGSHQRAEAPSVDSMNTAAIPVLCPAGSMIVFDSTLWHAAGRNTCGHDRLAINHQFTRAFFKQQVDYPRALGKEAITRLPPRSQQLLGWYSRVPAGLDEYYVPSEERFYLSGQG